MRASQTLPSSAAAAPAVAMLREPLECRMGAADLLAALAERPLPFALTGRWAGGGAIVGSDPLLVADDGDDPFAILDELPTLEHQAAHDHPHAVGGGWFGWLGYRLGARIERIPPGPARPVEMPEFHLAYYDNVLRLDPAGRWWFEALVAERRREELEDRLAWLRRLLGAAAANRSRRDPPAPPPLELPAAAAAHHLDAVARCRRRIAAGEIFQANICLRLETTYDGNAADLLRLALARTEPPYAAAFRTPRGELASLSPELFLRRRGALLTTAPIKGTIERNPDDPEAARRSLAQLRRSAKDAAEHVMIVDLMRNDLGRVCRYGSVTAARAPSAEPHPGLWHLVSRVQGTTRPEVGNGDVLRATFPPGSVTGAPKVQALHVIAELERAGREVYTGAIGYASPVAGLELNVAIRTLELRDGRLWLGAGGGIVADSDPETELREAIVKARSVASAIGTTVRVDERPARPDPALGVFETLLVKHGAVHELDAHLDRMRRSVRELYGLPLPDDAREQILGAADPGESRLRIDAVPAAGRIALSVAASAPPAQTPVALVPVTVADGIGAHKWRDRRLLDADRGGAVALIVDRDGAVLEAAWANFWLIDGERLITPPADGRILPGVTRARLLRIASSLGLEPREQLITLERARAADTLFLTSSLRLAVAAGFGEPPPGSPQVERIREALIRAGGGPRQC